MTATAITPPREPSAWERLKVNRNWLGFWFMLPAMAFLLLFLALWFLLSVWFTVKSVLGLLSLLGDRPPA